MEFESQEVFDELRDALRAEHRPATPTEIVLVDRIAEHIWLSQRAQKFADAAFLDHSEKWMALMLRYRTTHDRAFHKCLAELRTLRKERRKQEEFDSQNNESAQTHERSDFEEQPPQQFDSQIAKPHTPEEIDRLPPAEMHRLVQQSLKAANINLDDYANEMSEEDVLRIAS